MLSTPVQFQTPTFTRSPSLTPAIQNIAHQQTPVRNQLINKTPISAAHAVSRKLMQKSVNLLNVPKLKPNDKVPTDVAPTVKLFPSNQTPTHTGSEILDIPQFKAPIASMPKLPPH